MQSNGQKILVSAKSRDKEASKKSRRAQIATAQLLLEESVSTSPPLRQEGVMVYGPSRMQLVLACLIGWARTAGKITVIRYNSTCDPDTYYGNYSCGETTLIRMSLSVVHKRYEI